MNIEFLQKLKDTPLKFDPVGRTDFNIENIGMSLSKIASLEQLYNGGNPFPKVLKELLFIAGEQQYIFDNGGFEDSRESLTNYIEVTNYNMTRPFFSLGMHGSVGFEFIYLDEGDDPPVQVFTQDDDDQVEIYAWYPKLSDRVNNAVGIWDKPY
jgi:hypothetical protein